MSKRATNQRGKSLPTAATRAPEPHIPDQQIRRIVQAQFTQMSYSGPFPPSSEMRAYEDISPGFAAEVIALTRTQIEHRQSLETKALDASVEQARRGQHIAGLVALAGLLVAGAVGIWGNPLVGGAVALSDIAALAGTFLWGSRSQRQERVERAKIMSGHIDEQ